MSISSKLRLVFILCFIGGCVPQEVHVTEPAPKGLTGEMFKKAFIADCLRITQIEEWHESTAYRVDDSYNGEFTKDFISTETLFSLLKNCGRDPQSIRHLIE